MKESNTSFKWRFFTKEAVDEQYENALLDCKGLTCQKEIISKINKAFYNRLLLGYPFNPSTPKSNVCRIVKEYSGMEIDNPKAFSYNPKGPLNRANIEGFPVFYCSYNHNAAMKEMKDDLKVGETFYSSEWLIDFQEVTNSHSLVVNSQTLLNNSQASKVALSILDYLINISPYSKLPQNLKDGAKQFMIKIGDLFSLPDYNMSSAYAHDVLYSSLEKGHNIPILIYPSVTSGHRDLNLAIHPRFVDSCNMRLLHVVKLTIDSVYEAGSMKTTIYQVGFPDKNNKLIWKTPSRKSFSIYLDSIEIITENGNIFNGLDASVLLVDRTKYSISDVIDRCFNEIISLVKDPIDDIRNIEEFVEKPVRERLTFPLVNLVKTSSGWNPIKALSIDVGYISFYK